MYSHPKALQFIPENIRHGGGLFAGRIQISVSVPDPHTQSVKKCFRLLHPEDPVQRIHKFRPCAEITVRSHLFIGKIALAVSRSQNLLAGPVISLV